MWTRRVQRLTLQSTNVNTINLVDRITIDFAWYPGARDPLFGLIDPIVPLSTPGEAPREINYRWVRKGVTPIEQPMAGGRVTLPLPPGSQGVLTVFDTDWQIARTAAGVKMSAPGTMLGVQQRLNVLGYHLRAPGTPLTGIDASYGANAERAVLSFQVDYRQPSPAPAGSPAVALKVRGEWTNNPHIEDNLDSYTYDVETGDHVVTESFAKNPSFDDGAALRSALVAIVGM